MEENKQKLQSPLIMWRLQLLSISSRLWRDIAGRLKDRGLWYAVLFYMRERWNSSILFPYILKFFSKTMTRPSLDHTIIFFLLFCTYFLHWLKVLTAIQSLLWRGYSSGAVKCSRLGHGNTPSVNITSSLGNLRKFPSILPHQTQFPAFTSLTKGIPMLLHLHFVMTRQSDSSPRD